MKKGRIMFEMGRFWRKGQPMGTGQANPKAYERALPDLIQLGKAKPSWIISHELPLTEAPNSYRRFAARDEGWTNIVVLRPQLAAV
jgi:glutathione-independent formaldehyde dehydrogenase